MNTFLINYMYVCFTEWFYTVIDCCTERIYRDCKILGDSSMWHRIKNQGNHIYHLILLLFITNQNNCDVSNTGIVDNTYFLVNIKCHCVVNHTGIVDNIYVLENIKCHVYLSRQILSETNINDRVCVLTETLFY